MPASLPVSDLADLYRATLIRLDRLGGGSTSRGWNRLVDRMQWFQLALRTTEEGRTAITQMIDDVCPAVRTWSTANALAWDPEVAVAALCRRIAAGGTGSSEAATVLRDHEAAALSTAWTPQGRPPRELR